MDRYGRFQLGAALAIGLVFATLVGSRALVRVKSEDQTIAVTGSAKRSIRSDLVIWQATVTYKGDNMQAAYKPLAAATPKVVEYLKGKGIKANGDRRRLDRHQAAARARQGRARARGDDHRLHDVADRRGALDATSSA